VASASERLRGGVTVEIECPYPERLLNECARRGRVFRNLVRDSPISFKADVSARDSRRLRALSRDGAFDMAAERGTGAPALLRAARRRLLPAVLLAVVFLALRVSTLFVWEIEVRGNVRTPSYVILGALREHGFNYGTFGPSVVSEALADSLILDIPQLRWLAVNVRGSHADVLVRERVDKPELADARAPAMVCASKGGLIIRMSVLDGEPVRASGDVVAAGDVLVTGGVRGRRAAARAEIWARTWYELTAKAPEISEKRYTGEVKYRRYAVFAGKKINLSINSGIEWANYDKIVSERTLRLPTGNVLPFTLVTERLAEYEPAPGGDDGAAEETLRRALMDRLRGLIGDGEIRAAVCETSRADGGLVVTLRAECVEQIAVQRPMMAPEITQ
jgi:similar to stage IV sporulation protein